MKIDAAFDSIVFHRLLAAIMLSVAPKQGADVNSKNKKRITNNALKPEDADKLAKSEAGNKSRHFAQPS
jgi:hypothetical protein